MESLSDFLPQRSGVYLFRNAAGKIIYIGKANNLRRRIRSYFSPRSTTPKIAALRAEVRSIDYLLTTSSEESLLRERELIRRFQPYYNTVWRDDKSYPGLAISNQEDFPRLFITRQANDPKNIYFGPFPQSQLLRELLRQISRLFGIRQCKYNFDRKNPLDEKIARRCLYYLTRRCSAPCLNKISYSQYRQQVRNAVLFLSRKFNHLIKLLSTEMAKKSAAMRYEEAARIRDLIKLLKGISPTVQHRIITLAELKEPATITRVFQRLRKLLNLKNDPVRVAGIDVSNISGQLATASAVTFYLGEKELSGYRRFRIKSVQGPDDCAMIKEVVYRYLRNVYSQPDRLVDVLLIDGGRGQLQAAHQAVEKFQNDSGIKIDIGIISLAKEKEQIYYSLAAPPRQLPRTDPLRLFCQKVRDEAHRFALKYHTYRRKISVTGIILLVLFAGKVFARPPVSGGEVYYEEVIQELSSIYGVSPAIVKAVIKAESGFNPKEKSSKGAAGLMQLMPRTARCLGVKDIWDVRQNIRAGIIHLKNLLQYYNGDLTLALAAYNAGSGRVKNYRGVPPFNETRQYIHNVRKYYRQYNQSNRVYYYTDDQGITVFTNWR